MTTFEGTYLSGTFTAVFHTSMGDITVELDADAAPKAVTNFVTHAKNGYYDDLIFHRVITDFMIQGGDPDGVGTGGESIYGDNFEDELNDLGMDKGVVAMANAGPNTNGSQFFIVQSDDGAPWLIGKHTAFGKVIDGLDIVDAIATVKKDYSDKPLEDVTYTIEIQE